MNAITLMENPYVSVWFHPNTKIVHSRIHQFVSGKEFREFLMVGQAALIKNQAKKWLSDDRDNWVLAKDDLDWSRANWAPECARNGWKYWAIVRPEKVLAQVAMERLVEEYAHLGVTAKFFTDPRDAMTWLETQ